MSFECTRISFFKMHNLDKKRYNMHMASFVFGRKKNKKMCVCISDVWSQES